MSDRFPEHPTGPRDAAPDPSATDSGGMVLPVGILVAAITIPAAARFYFGVPWLFAAANGLPFALLLGVVLASGEGAGRRRARRAFLVCLALLAVPYGMVLVSAALAPTGGADIGAGLLLIVTSLATVAYALAVTLRSLR